MNLRTGNNRRKRKLNGTRRFERCCALPDYTPEFGRGYLYCFVKYKPDVERRYYQKLQRWTPKNPKAYYYEKLRYAGWVVMEHTKYYRRLWRDRNPHKWRAYS